LPENINIICMGFRKR